MQKGGLVRSNILFSEVSSIFELFSRRSLEITIYKGIAVDPTSKVKNVIHDPNTCIVDVTPTSAIQTVVFLSEPSPGLCWYCKRNTKDDIRVGLPISMRDDKFHQMINIDIEGCACNYSCAYSFLRERSHGDTVYVGREIILRKIYELLFPRQELKAAPNFRLLKENGGLLTDEEYDSGAHGFVPIPGLKYRVCSAVFKAATA